MSRKVDPSHFGQAKTFKPPWTENEVRRLAFRDATAVDDLPLTKNVTLSLQNNNQAGVFAFRWQITFGVGGGKTVFEIDANGSQQISLSADTLEIALKCSGLYAPGSPLKSQAFGSPVGDVRGVAFLTQTSTATNQPTLTQLVEMPAGPVAGASLLAPTFASGVRICGESDAGAANPFLANKTYSIDDTNFGIDLYNGTELVTLGRTTFIPIGTGIGL